MCSNCKRWKSGSDANKIIDSEQQHIQVDLKPTSLVSLEGKGSPDELEGSKDKIMFLNKLVLNLHRAGFCKPRLSQVLSEAGLIPT